MAASFHQSLANDLPDLKRLMDNATGFLESEGVDAQAVFRINLTLEEVVTNIIKFGRNAQGPREIEVTVDVSTVEVKAVIVHHGCEFDPMLHERKRPAESLSDRQTGGLGIHLIKKMLDGMSYRREGERNIVEVKALRKARS